ncbi:MAG: hypothetical protein K9G44_12040, partial [Melioribacteraceae bacterium]|nr:hypothetical protein [Melioribacteraceae bacterium]
MLNYLVLLLLFSISQLMAQVNYYNYKNTEIQLIPNDDVIVLVFNKGMENKLKELVENQQIIKSTQQLQLMKSEEAYRFISANKLLLNDTLNSYRQNNIIKSIRHVYVLNGHEIISNNQIIIKFITVEKEKLDSLNSRYGLRILKDLNASDNKYRLEFAGNENIDILEIANIYYNSLKLEYSIPDFYRNYRTTNPNDPFFTEQYYLHNAVVVGADINIVPS